MDIPGFYYDPDKKKYFRIQNNVQQHLPVTDQTVGLRKSLDTHKQTQASVPICLPSSLHKHEVNYRQRTFNLQEDVLRCQLRNLKLQKSRKTNPIDYCGTLMKNPKCNYLLGSTVNSDELFAVISGESGSLVYRINVDHFLKDDYILDEHCQTVNCYPPGNKIVEINIDMPNSIVTLTNHFSSNLINEHSSVSVDSTDFNNSYNFSMNFEFPEVLFSCATNTNSLIAVGGENKILGISASISNGNSNRLKMKTRGRVTALKFRDVNILLSGCNNGYLRCFDLRTYKKPIFSSEISKNSSVSYLDVLTEKNHFITSSHNGKLMLFDLRKIDMPLIHFDGHINKCKKIPFSFDENFKILCSAGQDYVTRFWSLQTGKLMHVDTYLLNSIVILNESFQVKNLTAYSWYSHSWKNCCGNNLLKPLIFNFYKDKLSLSTNLYDVINE